MSYTPKNKDMKHQPVMSLEENRFCNYKNQECPDFPINNLVVYSDYAVVYREHHRQPTYKSQLNITEANKVNRKYNGYMSPQTKRKITKILEAWLSAIKYNNKLEDIALIRNSRKPVFITLTMSSQQVHDDYEIKRKLLIPFIQHLTKWYNVKYYFWRAEKQLNGNIHFHMIIDSYIDKYELQNLWNRFQDKLGYIESFYKKYGHKNPPSTQVQKVPDRSDLVSYMIKYATKDESVHIVKGRIWGCSDELRELKPFVENIDSGVTDALEEMRNSAYYTFVEKEHVTIIYFNRNEKKDSLPKELLGRIEKYYIELFEELYKGIRKKEPEEIEEENTEDICVQDYEEIWHQETLQYDIFL